MSDVLIVFEEALKIKNEKEAIDYIFQNLSEVPTDALLKMWYDFLDNRHSKLKKMQTGGSMANALPTNSVFRGKITNLY